MTTSKEREKYKLVRYDYYHAGRVLHLMGNFHSACIMLGYAVETTMKAGLLEVLTNDEQKKNGILNRSHNIKNIYDECRNHNLFNNVRVSDDFIDHIYYHFQRYPSQMMEVRSSSSKHNKEHANSTDWLYYYDDLCAGLAKLDRCISEEDAL